MNKYLIFCDLDSTLLINHTSISKKTIKLIRSLVKDGHIFTMATGRPLQATLEFYKQLKITCPIVCDNGSTIYIPHKRYRKSKYTFSFIKDNSTNTFFSINKDIVKEILNKLNGHIVCLYGYTNSNIVTQNFEEAPFWMKHLDNSLPIKDGVMADYLDSDINILSIFSDNYDYTKEILDLYDVSYQYWGLDNGRHAFEVQAANASKGKALLYVANKYNINLANTMAFGDSLNDISMLEVANISVGMINSKDDVKNHVKYFTKYDSEHDGVRIFLSEYFKKS